ncbi:MAG: hypothetical protein ACRC46_03965 [Thermoguttaceae bacterium]
MPTNPQPWPDWLGINNGINSINIVDRRGQTANPGANNNNGLLIAGVGGWGIGAPPAGTDPSRSFQWGGSPGRTLNVNGDTNGRLWIGDAFTLGNGGTINVGGNAGFTVSRQGANVSTNASLFQLNASTFNNNGLFSLVLNNAANNRANWWQRNVFALTYSNGASIFNNAGDSSVTNADAWYLQGGPAPSQLNNRGYISGATNWVAAASIISNFGSGVGGSITAAPTPPAANLPAGVAGGWTWYMLGSTLNNTFAGDDATISLGAGGQMFIIGSTLNATGGATNFSGGPRGGQSGNSDYSSINGREVILSGTGPTSNYGGDAIPVEITSPFINMFQVLPLASPASGEHIGYYNQATGFRWFNVAGETDGSADLRFATVNTEIYYDLTGLLNVNINSTIYLDRWRDNKTVIRVADTTARIYNPRMFLDGTFGRTAYRLQLDSITPNQNQYNSTQLPNTNLLYNIIRTQGGDSHLGVTSDIHIARIAPEWTPLALASPTAPPLPPQLLQVLAENGLNINNANVNANPVVYNTYDFAYLYHNPNSPFYVGKPTVVQTQVPLIFDGGSYLHDAFDNALGLANPWYNTNEYNAAWDPTNNPNSVSYKVTGGIYNEFYDPSAAVHNAGNPTAPSYNPQFDRSSPNYNTASWYGMAAPPVGKSVLPHIAYNPYVDANGYSGGLTKVDTGLLWLQASEFRFLNVLDAAGVATVFNRTGAQMNRDINSLIDVQGGILRFNRQEDLRPVWRAAAENVVFNNNTGLYVDDNPITNQYAPAQRYNINPNGYVNTAAGEVAPDRSNYYTIQLNTLTNPNDAAARNATTLSTSGGHHYRTATVSDPLRDRAANDNRLIVNNRIILHGGGTFEVGYDSGANGYWFTTVNGEYVEDDSLYRTYTVKSPEYDNPNNIQGGGVGNDWGYLWLNNATLVGQRPTEGITPFLNKTGAGVLDLTGVNWEYENGLTNVEINVDQGTLAFTNQADLGSGRIALQGRDAILALLKDSELDRGSIKYNPNSASGLNRDLVSGYDTNWGAGGAPTTIMNPNADTTPTEINNIIALVDGGTINVVQGGRPPVVGSLIFPQPFYSEFDITKTRAKDGYENQHNFIVKGDRIQGNGSLRKIGLGMLTLEGDYRVATGAVTFPVREGQTRRTYNGVQFELQRGTLRFSQETNLGGIAGGVAGGTILFTLDKNATLQYYGKDQEMIVRNNVTMTYDRGLYNSGGATLDIRNSQSDTLMTTLRLTGTITGDSNFLTITKLGQLKSVLDMTQATMAGTAGAAKWDVRTGELAFNIQNNIGSGDIMLSEATMLHKVYQQPTGTPPASPHTQNVAIANNVLVRNNATIKIDGDATRIGGLLSRLTLRGDLSVQTQLDKMGDGILILDGSLARAGAADVGTTILGGLRIKEGPLEFSRRQQLVTTDIVNPQAISLNLYGAKAGLIYSGVGDVNPATRTPRPLTITNNINILPLYHDLTNSPRVANITVTDATGNLGLTGEQLRGGDLTLNDLKRDADGNPVINATTGKWETTSTSISGASTIVKDGLGTLTLSGVLNDDTKENISILIKQGKIAFSEQKNLGHATNNNLNNAIVLNGVSAKLEYLGTTPVGTPDTTQIANQLVFLNGGGTLSVLDSLDTFVLRDGQIVSNRDLSTIGSNTPYKGTTWTLAKEGAGKLDITAVDFSKPISPTGAALEHITDINIKEGTVVFNDVKNLTGGANKPLTISMGAQVPGIVIPGVITTYTTYTSGMLEYTGTANIPLANNLLLNGGKVVSPSTGLAIYDQLTGRQVVAGGGINVKNVDTNLVLTGAISGTGSFVKQGAGQLTITSANSGLTGDFIIERGTVELKTQQQFRGDIIVKNYLDGGNYEGATLVAGAGNVITNKNKLYLASGTTFDMSYNDGKNPTMQTLTGVMTLPIAGAGPSRILISKDCTIGTDPNGGPSNPTNTDIGNTLKLDLASGTTWHVGQIVGNDNSKLIISNGYILVDDLTHFHGTQSSTGGTIINGGSTDANRPYTFTNENVDKGEWVSCNVTVSNGHITVGQNPNLGGGGYWASCNVTARNNSTIDVAGDWVTSTLHKQDLRTPNVLLENGSRLSVGGNWQESGDISLDNSQLFVGGQWQHYEGFFTRWVDGLYDARYAEAAALNPGYNYDAAVYTGQQPPFFAQDGDIYWNQNTGTISNFVAIDKDLVYRSVTASNGSVILLAGNGTSGALSLDGSTLTVGHEVGGILALDTGNYNVTRGGGIGANATFANGSQGTILGNWKSGNLTLAGGSDLTVGHVTGGVLTANTGDVEIVADNTVAANRFISVGAGSVLTVYGNLNSGSVNALGNVSVGMWTPTGLPLSHGNASIDGTLFVGNGGSFRNAGTLTVRTAKDSSGNVVANQGRLIIGSNFDVESMVAIIGGSTVNIAKDWTTGEALINSSVVYVGNTLKTRDASGVPAAFESHDNSTVTVVEGWTTGDTWLDKTTTTVGGNFTASSLIVQGTVSGSGDNLKVGNSLGVGTVDAGGNLTGGRVTIVSDPASTKATSINVGQNWATGQIVTTGRNADVMVGGDFLSGSISSDGGRFTIMKSLTAGNGTTVIPGVVATSGVIWDVASNWTSDNVTLATASTFNVGGNFSSRGNDVKMINVQNSTVGGNWDSGQLSLTGGNSNLSVVGNLTSKAITSDGGSFIVGGGIDTGVSKVTTKGADWTVGQSWKSGDIDIRNAGKFSVGGDWSNVESTAKFTDVERIQITGNWTSKSLILSTLGNATSPNEVVMEVGGTFTPGTTLTLDMPKGRNPLSLNPVYRITAGDVSLAGTTIVVGNAVNLTALGKYYAAQIKSNSASPLPSPSSIKVSDISLFKRVVIEQPTGSVLDIYVNATGFSGYVNRLNEFGISGITHNQLEVIKNMTRIENQVTTFETAASTDRVDRMLVSASALTEPAAMSPLRTNAVVTDVLDKLITYGDNESIPVAVRSANISRALNELTGDTHANGLLIASTRPWMEGYDRLRMDNEMYFVGQNYAAESQAMRGQSARLARMNRLWITPSYTFDSLSSDDNARAASLGRTGFSFGLDRRIRHNATAGIMFNYNSARLKQDEDRVQGNDFGVGLYAGAMLGYYIELRSFLGCGFQNYESTRVFDTTFAGGNRQTASGRADGNSFGGSIEVARPLFFGLFIFKPTLGIDFTSYTRNAFTETGDAIRMNVGRTTYTRVSPRIGATWEAGTMNRLAVTTRLFAGYNLGDDYITAQTQFATIGGPTQDIRSIALGRGFIDAGIGTRYYLNATRSMSLHGNADVISSKRSLAGAFSIGASWMY